MNTAPHTHNAQGSSRPAPRNSDRVATGIAGLDNVLGGGLPERRLYLVQGAPGSGKTTLAVEFLLDGAARGETTLYISLSETKDELAAVAASHGWNVDAISVHDFSAVSDVVLPHSSQSVFPRADVELGQVITSIIEAFLTVKPSRVVIDSLSELWLLAGEPYRFRQQVLALKQFFAQHSATVLLLDDRSTDASDSHLGSVAHGVIDLDLASPEYGTERRRLRVLKLRGAAYRGGYHDYVIRTGGMIVFPRLVAMEYRHETSTELVHSGIPELDALLGGGLYRGTSTVLLGPAGVGKSTLGLQYARYAAKQGKKSAIFLFDEGLKTIMLNAASKDMGVDIDRGLIELRQIDPAEISPGEFAGMVRDAVERGVEMIGVDGVTGYLNAMPGDRYLMLQLHELTAYLAEKSVTAFLLVNQHGMIGPTATSPVDVSFLGDTVILFRYFEFGGEIRRAISVTKRRGGWHESSIRELTVTDRGLSLGEPLRQFRGLLTGVPIPTGPKGDIVQ